MSWNHWKWMLVCRPLTRNKIVLLCAENWRWHWAFADPLLKYRKFVANLYSKKKLVSIIRSYLITDGIKFNNFSMFFFFFFNKLIFCRTEMHAVLCATNNNKMPNTCYAIKRIDRYSNGSQVSDNCAPWSWSMPQWLLAQRVNVTGFCMFDGITGMSQCEPVFRGAFFFLCVKTTTQRERYMCRRRWSA